MLGSCFKRKKNRETGGYVDVGGYFRGFRAGSLTYNLIGGFSFGVCCWACRCLPILTGVNTKVSLVTANELC